jgi:predicted NBD/HSP70 family sugar kinase
MPTCSFQTHPADGPDFRHDYALSFGDVLQAAERGDSAAVDLITVSGRLLGQTLAPLVSFFNPSLVLLGRSAPSTDQGLL